MGKTNLDQFACGLVGTRSPHGTPANAFDDRCGDHRGAAAHAAGLARVAHVLMALVGRECGLGTHVLQPRWVQAGWLDLVSALVWFCPVSALLMLRVQCKGLAAHEQAEAS